MCKVLQRIPLRACLCVDVEFIIVCAEGGEGGEVDLFLGKGLAVEARELDVVEFPVELDGLARTDFFAGGAGDDGGGEEVDSFGLFSLGV